jgi:hypothetical protein
MGRKNKKNRKRKGALEESPSSQAAVDPNVKSLLDVQTTAQAKDEVDPSGNPAIGTDGLDVKIQSKKKRKRKRAGASFVAAEEDDGEKSSDNPDKSRSLVVAPSPKGKLRQKSLVSLPRKHVSKPIEPNCHGSHWSNNVQDGQPEETKCRPTVVEGRV